MSVFNQGLLELNADRRYPFMDGDSLMDQAGEFQLPNSLIVDVCLTIPLELYPSLLSSPAHLYSVQAGRGYIRVVLSAAGRMFRASSAPGTNVPAILWDEDNDPAGTIVFGRTDETLGALFGERIFASTAARLVPTAVVPGLSGVSSISVVDAAGVQSGRMKGDIILVAGDSVQLEAAAGSYDRITIGADIRRNEAADDPCECAGVLVEDLPPIRTINGVGPDEDGNIVIESGQCINVSPQGDRHAILLEDICGAPCPTSEELNAINVLAASLQVNQANLSAIAGELRRRLDTLLLPLLAPGSSIPES